MTWKVDQAPIWRLPMDSKISLMVLSTSDGPVLALETEVSPIRLMRANFLDCSLRIFAATSGQYTANESFAAHLDALKKPSSGRKQVPHGSQLRYPLSS